MPNIYDYVTWRGDLTFAERPFSELDNLVLCQLSYIDMSRAFPPGRSFPQEISSGYCSNADS